MMVQTAPHDAQAHAEVRRPPIPGAGRPWILGSAAAALAAAMVAAPLPARAGARAYSYVLGFDSLPQAGAEVENWFGAERDREGETSWEWWTGPVAGITDRTEIAVYGIFYQDPPEEDEEPFLVLSSLRIQVGQQFADKGAWPVDLRFVGQVGVPVDPDKGFEAWLSLVASKDIRRLNLTLEAGGWFKFSEKGVVPYLNPGLGASVDLGKGVRLGGEVFTRVRFSPDETRASFFAGPDLAFGVGRFWATAGVSFGLTEQSDFARGRLLLGLAF